MKYFRFTLPVMWACFASLAAMAQDPQQPANNYALSNLHDGIAPGTGWFFKEYIQSYSSRHNKDYFGNDIGGHKISSLLSMSQLIYISKSKIAGGNVGFTVLVPVVKISDNNLSRTGPSINPGVLGDIIAGPLIQWFDKRLLNMKFDHRLEVDLISPTGAYSRMYDINAGANLFSISPHYSFTIFPVNNLSFSMRHMLNYNFRQIKSSTHQGMSYNFNYSFAYAVAPSLNIEIAGYYLTQLQQDSYDGNHHYFQDHFLIADTRERAFAYGPGVGYVTSTGLALEVKTMWETGVKNRSEGLRSTLVLAYRLH